MSDEGEGEGEGEGGAFFAGIGRAVRLISEARFIPTSRDSFWLRPQNGAMPNFACVS